MTIDDVLQHAFLSNGSEALTEPKVCRCVTCGLRELDGGRLRNVIAESCFQRIGVIGVNLGIVSCPGNRDIGKS